MRVAAAMGVALALAAAGACQREAGEAGDDGPSRAERRIDEELGPAAEVQPREGLAAAILIDVSGSMVEEGDGPDGRETRKIEVARRAARDLVEQFARYADDHTGEAVLLGLYEFSERDGEPDCRAVIEMAPPDRARADAAMKRMRAQGGTPIGNAMMAAKRQLDATGLSRRHLLVVTDGENTDGFDPDEVTRVINRRPEAERPSIYFVAFDIDERRFTRVRDAGALLLGATDARDLNDTLESLLRGQILIEK